MDNQQNEAAKAQEYDQSVMAYQKVDAEIDRLLTSRGGRPENLTNEEFAHYRELADLRDLAYNKMKMLEQNLLDEV